MSFDGGCPTSTRVGSIGMLFVGVDGTVLLTVGEHGVGSSGYSKFLGLLCALETLIEQKWHTGGDYVHISGGRQFVMKVMTREWDTLKLHLLEMYE